MAAAAELRSINDDITLLGELSTVTRYGRTGVARPNCPPSSSRGSIGPR